MNSSSFCDLMKAQTQLFGAMNSSSFCERMKANAPAIRAALLTSDPAAIRRIECWYFKQHCNSMPAATAFVALLRAIDDGSS